MLSRPVLVLGVVSSPALVVAAWTSIALAGACAAAIVVDMAMGVRQHMAVMYAVWPLTALYAGPFALIAYFAFGRPGRDGTMKHHHSSAGHSMHDSQRPMWQSALLGATHCGAGCMLGDVLVDGALYLFGLTTLLAGSALLTSYAFDFVAAYVLGVVFQYFAIAPMRHLGVREGLVAAVKADTLSLVAFQVGMYAWMAVYQKVLFHPRLEASSPVYWLMMQVGMLAGLATSYPMNWWLVRAGVKEAM